MGIVGVMWCPHCWREAIGHAKLELGYLLSVLVSLGMCIQPIFLMVETAGMSLLVQAMQRFPL